jgi:O-antigen ligase
MQHNILLAYLTETGLVGMGLLVTMLTSMSVQAWRLWQNQQHDMLVRLFGLLMLAILLNYIINGMFHDVSIIPLANALIVFFAGLVSNLSTAALALPSPDASSEQSLFPRTLHAAQ